MKKVITETDIIQDLIHNIYCRLKPSPLHGIGVFAIRDIPKGTNPFLTLEDKEEEDTAIVIPFDQIQKNSHIHSAVKTMLKDFYAMEKGAMFFDNHNLNEINISFYMNHSDTPNVIDVDGGHPFIAARDIKEGEELFINYSTFSDTPEKF